MRQQDSSEYDPPMENRIQPESKPPHHTVMMSRALTGIFLLAVLYTIYFARIFLMPLAFALVFAILLHPLVRTLHRIKVPYAAGAGVVVLILVLSVGAGIYYLSAPAAKWLDRGPQILISLEFKMYDIKNTLKKAREATRQLEELTNLGEEKQQVETAENNLAGKVVTGMQSFTVSAIIILVLLYFILAHGWRIMQRLSGSRKSAGSGRAYAIMVSIKDELSVYLMTITAINFFLGVFTAIAMAILGLPNPILWGVMAGLLNFAPYLGATVTLTVIGLVSLLTFESWDRIVLPPLIFFVLTALEGQFVTPSVVGYRLTVNPVLVLVSILFWGWMWGIAGAVLGVPLLAAFLIAAKNIDSLKDVVKIVS